MVRFGDVVRRRCGLVESKSVEISVIMSVLVFNAGLSKLVTVQKCFGLDVGECSLDHAERKDGERLKRKSTSGVSRKNRMHRRVTDRQRQLQKEGVTYAAGKF